MGELHTVFCTMKVLRKIIHTSGLDMSLSIADIYGTITIEQINSEKHVYRSFEGYLIYRHKSGYLREIYGLA